MTNPKEIIETYQRYCEAQATANRMNKGALFEALASSGITGVTVEFHGEGDSGQIGEITALSGDVAVALPELKLTLHHASYNSGKVDSKESDLTEAIVSLCFDFLEQKQEGWENDYGAFGEFAFDVAGRKIDLEFNARFTDSTLFCHSF